MSNKPRKQKKRARERSQSPSREAAVATASAHAGEAKGGHSEADEILHAPKEVSKLRFAVMIGLVVVLLVIFIVPTALINIAGGGGNEDSVVVEWTLPGQDDATALRYTDFTLERRAFEAAFAVDPLLKMQLGMFERDLSDQELVRLILLDQLALDAGIRVTQADLGEHLQSMIGFMYQSADQYKQAASRYGLAYVEQNLKRALRASRFLQLAGYAGGLADPAAIEEAWHRDHVEMTFDYVELEVASLEEAARDELPEDAELEAWFLEQPEAERREFLEPERRGAQVVRFVDAATTPAAGLLEAYPEPEDADAEERADDYYNRVFHVRFVRPPEEPEEPEETEDADAEEEDEDAPPEPPAPQEFIPFDEVKDACLAEAPVYYALQSWLADLQSRQNAGEEIDLAAEAGEMGLELVTLDEPLSREDMTAHEELGDEPLVNEVFLTPPEAFAYKTVVTEGELALVRVTVRVEPQLPDFAEIKEGVAELWAEPRAEELALERMKAVWEGFEEFTPEKDEDEPEPPPGLDPPVQRRAEAEAFRTACEAAELTVESRDWQDKADQSGEDFEWRAYYELEDAEVGEPQLRQDGETILLVRRSDEREVPIEGMSPRDYDRYKSQARTSAAGALTEGYDQAYLEEHFGLVWYRDTTPEEEEFFDEEFEEEEDEPEGSEEAGS